jgi:hypothetical protein
MLTTTLDTVAIPTNVGTTVIAAILPNGRQVWLGESQAQGAKRAKIEVFSGTADPRVGSGRALAALERTLRRLEADAEACAPITDSEVGTFYNYDPYVA